MVDELSKILRMGKVQHLMRAAKLYNQRKAERKARIAAEPQDLHDAHVRVRVKMTEGMSSLELLEAGLLWTRPDLCRGLRAMVGIREPDEDGAPGRS